MKVYVIDRAQFFDCDVEEEWIKGKGWTIATASRGRWCKGCNMFHTIFDDIRFDVSLFRYNGKKFLALTANTIMQARLLPGFRAVA